MHSNLPLAAISVLLLLLQDATAAPHSKRCLTPAQIDIFQAHWPKIAGHGPVMVPCSSINVIADVENAMPSSTEIGALARRYLAATGEPLGKRCMTAAQIEAFQDAWPEGAGRGPAMVACPGENGEDGSDLVV